MRFIVMAHVAILAVVCVTVSIAIVAFWGTSGSLADLRPGRRPSSIDMDLSEEMPKELAQSSSLLDDVAIDAPSPLPDAAQAPIAGPAGTSDLPPSEDGLTAVRGQEPSLAGSDPAREESDPEIPIAAPTSIALPAPVAQATAAPAAIDQRSPMPPLPPAATRGMIDSTMTGAATTSGETSASGAPAESATPPAGLPPSAEAGRISAPSGEQAPAVPVAGADAGTKQAAVVSRPARSTETSLTLQQIVARGDALLLMKDVVSARLFYELAASRGSAAAAAMVGKTYDPFYLSEANLSGAQADPAKAKDWYRKAIEAGDSDAAVLLRSIDERRR